MFIQAPLWYMHHSSMTGQRRSSILTRHFFKTWVSFGSGCSWKLEGRYRQELDGPGLHTGSPGLKKLIWGLSSAFTCLCVKSTRQPEIVEGFGEGETHKGGCGQEVILACEWEVGPLEAESQ